MLGNTQLYATSRNSRKPAWICYETNRYQLTTAKGYNKAITSHLLTSYGHCQNLSCPFLGGCCTVAALATGQMCAQYIQPFTEVCIQSVVRSIMTCTARGQRFWCARNNNKRSSNHLAQILTTSTKRQEHTCILWTNDLDAQRVSLRSWQIIRVVPPEP